jgi:hypothetical protein
VPVEALVASIFLILSLVICIKLEFFGFKSTDKNRLVIDLLPFLVLRFIANRNRY